MAEYYITCGLEFKSLSINIGEGAIIMPGANIQPFCNVGKCVIVWPGAIVGHDTVIEDYCWLTAGSAIGGNAPYWTKYIRRNKCNSC